MATINISAATATAIKGWSTTVQNFSDLGAPPAVDVIESRAAGSWNSGTRTLKS